MNGSSDIRIHMASRTPDQSLQAAYQADGFWRKINTTVRGRLVIFTNIPERVVLYFVVPTPQYDQLRDNVILGNVLELLKTELPIW